MNEAQREHVKKSAESMERTIQRENSLPPSEARLAFLIESLNAAYAAGAADENEACAKWLVKKGPKIHINVIWTTVANMLRARAKVTR